jgi:putative OPT family oligopeptide transporter
MENEKLTFKPYIGKDKSITEFSAKSIIMGVILGFFFAIGNAYLGLKIGATISASIPAAIISMGTFKFLFRKKVTILENNIVQTIATVGEGLAAGVIFTIPALIILNEPPSIGRIFIISFLGGILGVLFMIPMRRYIIVEEHKVLPFPEGTACAEILKTGEKEHKTAIMALWGLIVGAIYKVSSGIFGLWEEKFTYILKPFQNANISVDSTPALMGVGFIIGPRVTSIMFSGGALAWLVIIPLISMFSDPNAIIYPSKIPFSMMNSQEIWSNYVRYIGAGTVATGGMLSLIKIWPVIYKTVHIGIKELFSGLKQKKTLDRTDQDISLAWLIIGSIAIILALWILPLSMNLTTIILLAIIGFFFVAVTSITVGIVGSTSNPVSGMTITTLLITCLIFVLLGWTERFYLIAAITMAAVANIAICMAATTSQDLKAGFLLGATPKKQQIAEIIGVFIPAIALGATLYILNEAYTLGSETMPAPQATLMALIAQGVIEGNLPYTLFIIGVVIALITQLLKIPVLPFAIGLYLPLSLTSGILIGGIASWYLNRHSQKDEAREKGILISSGFVGGDACVGIIIAVLTVFGIISPEMKKILPTYFSLISYLLLGFFLVYLSLKNTKKV